MKLRIADNLTLPLDVVTQKLGWLGVTGSGKTYGASKFAELLWAARAQFVVLDIVGTWYGLRLAKDGKKPSEITVPVFGGLHGDVPLEPTAGALLADLIVDRTLSCVLDLSQFESDADKARFALAFADRFFFRKKAMPSAVHLFLEECQELVPQNPQKGEERMLHAFTRLQKLGRNFGVGSSYISQRPQEVNKKALNMAQTLFVFRTTGTHERKAIEQWIQDKALDQDIVGDLPKIPTGHCHVWSPEFLKISEMAHILPKETFDASATPEVGEGAVTRHLAPIDLKQIASDMAATIEKAKADDPKELRKQIAAGQKRIKELESNAGGGAEREVERRVREAVAEQGQAVAQLSRTLIERDRTIRKLHDGVTDGVRRLAALAEIEPPTMGTYTATKPLPRRELPKREADTIPRDTRRDIDADKRNGASPNGAIPKGERITLIATAQHDGGVTREQLTVLTGYKRSSRDAYVQRLREKGYVETSDNQITATRDGIDALGNDYEPLPTGAELLRYWLEKLPEGEKRVLEVVTRHYPDAVDRTYIDEQTEYKRSSRDAYIQRLKSRQLVQVSGGGVVASKQLFD